MSSTKQLTAGEILDLFYEAETKYISAPEPSRDFSAMTAVLSSDFEVIQSPDLPWGGVWKGHAGFQKWCENMASRFDILEVNNPRILQQQDGGDEVAVLSHLKLRLRKSKAVWENPLVQVIKVDLEKGLITSIRPVYWDVAGLNALITKHGE